LTRQSSVQEADEASLTTRRRRASAGGVRVHRWRLREHRCLEKPKSTNTALVVSFTMTKLGQSPVKQTYRIFCADMGTGDASVTFVCSRLTGVFRYRYFAIPSGDCRVRGA
jgi:hypothetical protein